ncbi:MAG: hypothetical protein VX420_05480 [SAR324 cluster bacterium]|nr:hypothetical protein [SAR324 cluster bacterium]
MPELESGQALAARKPISTDWNDGRYNKRSYRPVHPRSFRNCVRFVVQKIAKTRC